MHNLIWYWHRPVGNAAHEHGEHSRRDFVSDGGERYVLKNSPCICCWVQSRAKSGMRLGEIGRWFNAGQSDGCNGTGGQGDGANTGWIFPIVLQQQCRQGGIPRGAKGLHQFLVLLFDTVTEVPFIC